MNRKKLIAVVAAACAIAISVAAIAQGSGSGTKQSASKASAGTRSGGHPPGGMMGGGVGLRGAVHSESVVPNKAGTVFITVTTDAGTVQSVDGGAGTVTIVEGTQSATYKTVTLTVPSSATIVRDGKTASLGEIKAKDRVAVSSSSEGTRVFATDSSFRPQGPGGAGPHGIGGPAGGAPPSGGASGAEPGYGAATSPPTGTTTTE